MDRAYNIWYNKFIEEVRTAIQYMKEEYCDRLNLDIRLNLNYDFRNKRWLGAHSVKGFNADAGYFTIAVNFPFMYKCMKDNGIEDDDYNIRAQAWITVGHECGHALFKYIVEYRGEDSEKASDFTRDFYDGEIDEEEIVEEFGEYVVSDVTGTYESILDDVLNTL